MILERKHTFDFDNINFDLSAFELPPEKVVEMLRELVQMRHVYNAAMKEMSTKLEILDDEFRLSHNHNPIHHMECRLKQPQSMMEKLKRRNYELSIESAMKNLTDIAGIRVVCHYIDDVYTIARLLEKQDDTVTLKKTDYIKNPKPNGYRSLHLVVSAPVYLAESARKVPVEIQIRTVAMDFWASLEHQLRYKFNSELEDSLRDELTESAGSIAMIDNKMQEIFTRIMSDPS